MCFSAADSAKAKPIMNPGGGGGGSLPLGPGVGARSGMDHSASIIDVIYTVCKELGLFSFGEKCLDEPEKWFHTNQAWPRYETQEWSIDVQNCNFYGIQAMPCGICVAAIYNNLYLLTGLA